MAAGGEIPGQAYMASLYRAKETAWCCLSCGMPFTLPMDAYTIDDPAVLRFNRVVKEAWRGMRDEKHCGTDQWDPEGCVLLDRSIGMSVLATFAKKAGWKGSKFVVQPLEKTNRGPHLDRILKACEPGLSDGALNALLNQAATAHEVEETILQPHILCKGCSSLCTDVLSKAPGADSWVSTIGKSVGPTVLYNMTASVGQKNLHNAVLGHCLQIIALSRFRLYSAATESEAYRWKMQALARLHVGAILYLCMRVVGAGRLAAHPTQDSFSLWYGCVFHPLVEWEQKRGTMLARTPLRDICAFGSDDTDFACASLFGSSATTLYTENTVQDLLKRIADLAEAYRFVLDPPRSKPSQQGSSRSTEYYESCCINESVSIFASPRIQWVPACILFGVKGHHLLRRLETSSRGCFASDPGGVRNTLTKYIQASMSQGNDSSRLLSTWS